MRAGALLLAGAGLVALSVADTAYRLRNWGAADGEVRAVLPGDDLVGRPADRVTVAVSVAAPAEEAWQALREAAVDAAGTEDLQIGLAVPLGEAPWVGRPRLAVLDPGRCLVLRHDAADAVRSFHVVPTGPGRCRLLARTCERRGGVERVTAAALDPLAILLTRRLLQRVAARATGEPGPAPRHDPAGEPALRTVR